MSKQGIPKNRSRDLELKNIDPSKLKRVSDVKNTEIDEAIGLKMIGIRLPISMIDTFKKRASRQGIGYQTYMKMILMNFIRSNDRSDSLPQTEFVKFDSSENTGSQNGSKILNKGRKKRV